MAILKKFQEGSDLTILNAVYTEAKKDEQTGKWSKDFIDIVYKNNITGEKGYETIYNPSYEFYLVKPEVKVDNHLFFIEKDKIDTIVCKYSEIEKVIAEKTNNLDFYYENCNAGNRKANKQLHFLNTVLGSNCNIEDHYRYRFNNEYKNETVPVTKAYFDIEVDTEYCGGDFPLPGQVPVNAISYICDSTKSISSFLYIDKNNPKSIEFKENFDKNSDELFDELYAFLIDVVGGPEKMKKFGLEDYRVQFAFFDDELAMIQSFFWQVNHDSPDFLLAWNMAFDIPYLIERIKNLGYDPAEIMSHPDFKEKYAEYYIDEKHGSDYELRGDLYKIASYTIYIDQLIQFASRRKGQAAFPNFKLDTAGEIITGVRKLDYSHITSKLSKLPYLDYKTFVFYNIVDTIVQKCIEVKSGDIDYLFAVAVLNNTRYAKAHRQTVYLGNLTRKFFYDLGYILGNNINTGNGVPYKGAMVGDPTHNSDYAKMRMVYDILNIINNLDDFDFKSLYPSIAREFNLAPNTQIGKIIIQDAIHNLENPYFDSMYDRGGQFVDDLCTENYLEICARWLHFGRMKELLQDVEEYFSMNVPSRILNTNEPYHIYNKDSVQKPYQIQEREDDLLAPYVMGIDMGRITKNIELAGIKRRY